MYNVLVKASYFIQKVILQRRIEAVEIEPSEAQSYLFLFILIYRGWWWGRDNVGR